jgi:hypothetical protein
MNAHLSTLVGLAVVASLVACSGATPEPLDRGNGTGGSASTLPAPAGSPAGTATSPSAPAAPPAKGGATGGGTPSADITACAASCTTSLAPKCQGDDAFCADICGSLAPAEIACVVAAPTCDKSVWVECASAAGGTGKGDVDAGAAAGKGK